MHMKMANKPVEVFGIWFDVVSVLCDAGMFFVFWFEIYISKICCADSLCLSSRAVCKKFGLHVSRMMLAFLVLSTGMFCSSSGK